LFSLSTTSHPSISRPAFEAREHEIERFVLRPRCFSRALCLWPWRTASVVPMIAGQAAIAVRIPSTMANKFELQATKRRFKNLILHKPVPGSEAQRGLQTLASVSMRLLPGVYAAPLSNRLKPDYWPLSRLVSSFTAVASGRYAVIVPSVFCTLGGHIRRVHPTYYSTPLNTPGFNSQVTPYRPPRLPRIETRDQIAL
jgi:hypothetical protein